MSGDKCPDKIEPDTRWVVNVESEECPCCGSETGGDGVLEAILNHLYMEQKMVLKLQEMCTGTHFTETGYSLCQIHDYLDAREVEIETHIDDIKRLGKILNVEGQITMPEWC